MVDFSDIGAPWQFLVLLIDFRWLVLMLKVMCIM